MNIKKILILIVIFLSILPTVVKAAEPEITATSGVVIDCLDGKVLYSKNQNEKLYPASMTNVLTAILVVENCNMQDKVTVSQNAINQVKSGYLTANIKAGEILTVEQLLNMLLISSYNDVANVLAEHVAGGTVEFAELMNKRAKELGCVNSNFVNCHGAHDENHYSTAYDMALIGKHAMQYDEIKNSVSKIYYELGATNVYEKEDRLYQTTNEMILTGSQNYYKYAKGMKTTFTTPAGYCIMAYSEKKDIPLVAVVMKSTTYDSRYEDAEKILEYVYDNNMIRTIIQLGTNIQTVNIKNGTDSTKKLNVILDSTIKAVVNIENKNTNIEPKVELKDSLKAPIAKGEVIGKVTYEIEGKTYTSNLIAENEVKKSKTTLVFVFIFFGLIFTIGGLRIRSLYNRNKVLRKIRGKKK